MLIVSIERSGFHLTQYYTLWQPATVHVVNRVVTDAFGQMVGSDDIPVDGIDDGFCFQLIKSSLSRLGVEVNQLGYHDQISQFNPVLASRCISHEAKGIRIPSHGQTKTYSRWKILQRKNKCM